MSPLLPDLPPGLRPFLPTLPPREAPPISTRRPFLSTFRGGPNPSGHLPSGPSLRATHKEQMSDAGGRGGGGGNQATPPLVNCSSGSTGSPRHSGWDPARGRAGGRVEFRARAGTPPRPSSRVRRVRGRGAGQPFGQPVAVNRWQPQRGGARYPISRSALPPPPGSRLGLLSLPFPLPPPWVWSSTWTCCPSPAGPSTSSPRRTASPSSCARWSCSKVGRAGRQALGLSGLGAEGPPPRRPAGRVTLQYGSLWHQLSVVYFSRAQIFA